MDKKSFYEDVIRETKIALSKVFSKVEEISKISIVKLRISNLKGKIKENKIEIGEFVISNKRKFSKIPKIIELLDKIMLLEEQIEEKKEQIVDLLEKDKDRVEIIEDKSTIS